jgi:S1-C subfamily serine protease
MLTLGGLGALGAGAAGCAGIRAPVERGEVIRRILPSTVQLRSEREGGARRAASGVVLVADPGSRRAWIVTARHFLDPPVPQHVYARRPGRGEAVVATIRARSEELDLALLEVQGLDLEPAVLKPTAALGDEVLIVAFPWGRRLTVVSGIVSQLAPEEGQLPVDGVPRMVDASVSYGSSGGGVFDGATGALVAVVEGYRTAKVALPERPDRPLEIPVAGETTLIAAPAIRRFLIDAGLAPFLPADGARPFILDDPGR